MRRYSKGKYEKIQLEYIDVREILEDLNISYREQGKNVGQGWIGVCCPFCGDNGYHIGINLRSATISCFKCGTTGTVIKYLSEELQSFNKAIQILSDSVPRELRSFEQEEKGRSIHVELPKKAKREITEYHAGYLQERGFDHEILSDLYNLHYCGPIGEWRNRIIIPVIRNYRLITFTSIDISDESNIRYKHLSEELSVIPIKHHLFGLEHTDGNSCIVTEGIFDMMRIGPGAVCTFGVKVTSEQKKLLSKFQRIKVLFDGDKEGWKMGRELANDLSVFCDVKLFELSEGTDPDKLSEEDIKKIKEC